MPRFTLRNVGWQVSRVEAERSSYEGLEVEQTRVVKLMKTCFLAGTVSPFWDHALRDSHKRRSMTASTQAGSSRNTKRHSF
jgi:hypothetical protein